MRETDRQTDRDSKEYEESEVSDPRFTTTGCETGLDSGHGQ